MEGGVEKENVENMEATKVAAGLIKQIDRGVVHQICSGQVVLSLATAAKVIINIQILQSGVTVKCLGTPGE